MKLVEQEANLETIKAQNRKDAERQSQQRDGKPVTRADCCEVLKVGDRQLRKICKLFNLTVPVTRKQLDVLLTKHLRHKKNLADKRAKQIKAAAEKLRGSR